MDYEKLYKEALERARAGKPLDEVFPELKESDDEMIRKKLVEYISDWKDGQMRWNSNKEFCSRALAYLEKQKEPLTPEEKMNHPLYLEGFDVGREVGEVVAKPAEWSEEDKKKLNGITNCLCFTSGDIDGFDEWYDWLKDLPNRFALQPKQEWSEEDEERLDSIIESYKELLKDYKACHDVDYIPYNSDTVIRNVVDDVNFLKSLRPQPKAELTLLDENIINAAVAFVEQNNHFNCWRGIDKHTVIKALRSLKPHWKPSEEQMEWLESAVRLSTDKPRIHGIIISLYEQLKRL